MNGTAQEALSLLNVPGKGMQCSETVATRRRAVQAGRYAFAEEGRGTLSTRKSLPPALYSGQTSKIIGIAVATTRISSGKPMRQ